LADLRGKTEARLIFGKKRVNGEISEMPVYQREPNKGSLLYCASPSSCAQAKIESPFLHHGTATTHGAVQRQAQIPFLCPPNEKGQSPSWRLALLVRFCSQKRRTIPYSFLTPASRSRFRLTLLRVAAVTLVQERVYCLWGHPRISCYLHQRGSGHGP
jgi:hypothetical protein